MVPLDQEPLRRKATSDCTREMERLEKARMEWSRFEQEDKPAFERWMAATFGALMTELRENDALIRSKSLLVQEVELDLMLNGGRNYRAAYARVLRQRSEAENPPPRSEGRGPHGEPSGQTDEEEGTQEAEEPDEFEQELLFERFVREMLGINPDRLSDRKYAELFAQFRANVFHRRRGPGPKPAPEREPLPEPPKAGLARIKEIYRALVRRLHPDTRAGHGPAVSSLWHEVQAAYEAGNLERLETLLALTDIQSNGAGAHTTLFQIRSVLRELRLAFQAIQRSLQEARRSPAWNFSRMGERRLFQRQHERKLRSDLAAQRAHLQDLEELIASWEPRPGTGPRRSAGCR